MSEILGRPCLYLSLATRTLPGCNEFIVFRKVKVWLALVIIYSRLYLYYRDLLISTFIIEINWCLVISANISGILLFCRKNYQFQHVALKREVSWYWCPSIQVSHSFVRL